MARTVPLVGLALIAIVGRCWAGERLLTLGSASQPLPIGSEVRKAVQQSTGYLAREGLAWQQKQQCASCHHIPFMVWALNEARDHGYPIDDKTLDNVTVWALDQRNHTQVFPDLPLDKKHSETDYLGPLLMALGVGAAEHRTPTRESARQRLIDFALTPQAHDGSWNPNSLRGRPPVHSTPDVQTSLLFLALSDSSLPGDPPGSWKAQRTSSADWLLRNSPADSLQASIMRLLVNRRLKMPDDKSAPLLESILGHQNDDGGWSQTPEMKSDAFATGLALYALSDRSTGDVGRAISRATRFLLGSQLADGSWPMASRHAEPTGPGPASDLRPIKYVGTAWATIGLVRATPASRRDDSRERPPLGRDDGAGTTIDEGSKGVRESIRGSESSAKPAQA